MPEAPPAGPTPAGGPDAALAGLGPFFAVRPFDPATPPGPPWQPMRALADDPAVFADRVARVRAALAAAAGRDVEERVAVSVAQLGLVARLLAPALAYAVEVGTVWPLPLSAPYWQPALGGPFPLALPTPPPAVLRGAAPADLADRFRRGVLDGAVRDLVAIAGRWPLSVRIRWGNVASALGGAAGMLAAGRPQLRDRTVALRAALLRTPPLRGTATVDGAGRLRRTSCCLIYRTAGRADPANLCGDCVLAARR